MTILVVGIEIQIFRYLKDFRKIIKTDAEKAIIAALFTLNYGL